MKWNINTIKSLALILYNRKLLIILIIAIIIRLGFIINIYHKYGYSNFSDDWEYIGYAKELLKGHIIDFDYNNPQLDSIVLNDRIGPGLPILLLPILALFGDNYSAVFVMNIILQCLSIILVYQISIRIFNHRVAFYASTWMALYYYYFRYLPRVLKEPLLVFLVLALVLAVLMSVDSKRSIVLLLPALIFTYLCHTDERFLAFFPIIILTYFLIGKNNYKDRLLKVTGFIITVILFSTPWLIRNYIKYDRTVLITTRLQDKINSSLGSDPVIESKFKSYSEFAQAKRNRFPPSDAELKYLKTHSEPHIFKGGEKIWRNILEHWRIARFKPGYVTNGLRFADKRPLLNNIVKIIIWGCPLLFSIYGCKKIISSKNYPALILVGMITVNAIIHSGLIVAGMQRYRIPVDALVIIIGMYGLTTFLNSFGSRGQREFI